MELVGWERIVKVYNETFFTPLLLIVCQLIALIIGIKYKRSELIFNLFLFYIISGLLLLVGNDLYLATTKTLLKRGLKSYLNEASNLTFATIELIVFTKFFSKVLTSKSLKYFLYFFEVVFILLIVIFISKAVDTNAYKSSLRRFSDKALSLELTIIVICCLVFYYELLTKKTDKDLLQSPSFWIVTGLFFYCLVIIPFFFISDQLFSSYKSLYAILFGVHYIFSSILYICIAKAFLCKKPLTT